ncbi:MAG: hypothetical protein Q9227_004455 [Pyrenula ochraceoflavens]
MAKSLDALMDHLLGEIAISGTRGIGVGELIGLIDSFYDNDQASRVENEGDRSTAAPRKACIDRQFQAQVWKWLRRHPDIRIGENNEGNQLTLDQVLPVGADQESQTFSMTASARQNGADGRSSKHSAQTSQQSQSDRKKSLRIFVTESRMWLAICGHLPDPSKVVPLEFVLLSIIASAREKGILQAELVKISGQDKRSVPKRTDRLHAAGYIEKRRIQVVNSLTSLLKLRRYAGDSEKRHTLAKTGEVATNDRAGKEIEFVDFGPLIQSLFEHLRTDRLVTHKSLKTRLNLDNKWRGRIFSRLVRRLEESGCVKRVRASSKDSANLNWFYPSIKYIREPTEEDLTQYVTHGSNTNSLSDNAWKTSSEKMDEDEEQEEELEENARSQLDLEGISGLQLVEVGKPLAQWNPDRPLINTIHDIVHRSTENGASTLDIRYNTLGQFFQRPTENTLDRLVLNWVHTQPAHIKHLALLRDVDMEGKVISYIHYSFSAFRKLVEEKRTLWEAVLPREKNQKAMISRLDGPTAMVAKENFGFPKIPTPPHLHKQGDTTLGQATKAAAPQPRYLLAGDPYIVVKDGNIREWPPSKDIYMLKQDCADIEISNTVRGRPRGRRNSRRLSANDSTQTLQPVHAQATDPHYDRLEEEYKNPPVTTDQCLPDAPKTTSRRRYDPTKAHGRPRKYLKGTEKYWQNMFAKIVLKDCPPENKHTRLANKMSDPKAVAFFNSRPTSFDETLVTAIDKALPVPIEPDDISQKWIDQTRALLSCPEGRCIVGPKITTDTAHEFSQMAVLRSRQLVQTSRAMRETSNVQPTEEHHSEIGNAELSARSTLHDFMASANEVSKTQLEKLNTPKIAGKQTPRKPSVDPLTLTVTNTQQGLESSDQLDSKRPPSRSSNQHSEDVSEIGPNSKFAGGRKGIHTKKSPFPSTLVHRESLLVSDATELKISTPSAPRRRGRLKRNQHAPSIQPQYLDTTAGQSEKPVAEESTVSTLELEKGISTRSGRLLPAVSETSNSTWPTLNRVKRRLSDEPSTSERPSKILRLRIPSTAMTRNLPATRASPASISQSEAGLRDNGVQSCDNIMQQRVRTPNLDPQNAGAPISNSMPVQPVLEIDPLESRENTVEETPQINVDATYESIPTICHDDHFENGPHTPSRGKNFSLSRGTLGIRRRKIILDIVEVTDGVMPFDLSLWFAFCAKWRELGQKTTPDVRTVRTTVKSAVEDGKLKKLGFGFKDRKGMMRTAHMIARQDISPTSLQARELMENMIEKFPDIYYRPELQYDQRAKRRSFLSSQKRKLGFAEIDRAVQTVSDFAPSHVRKMAEKTQEKASWQSSGKWSQFPAGMQRNHFAGGHQLSKWSSRRPIKTAPLHLKDTTRRAIDTLLPGDPNPLDYNLKPISHFRESRLPCSLDDILRDDRRRKKIDHNCEDAASQLFSWKVDGVAKWEIRKSGLFIHKSSDWQFINHVMEGLAPTNQSLEDLSRMALIHFEGLVRFDEQGNEYLDISPYSNGEVEGISLTKFHVPDTEQLEFHTTPFSMSNNKQRTTETHTDLPLEPHQTSEGEKDSRPKKRTYRRRQERNAPDSVNEGDNNQIRKKRAYRKRQPQDAEMAFENGTGNEDVLNEPVGGSAPIDELFGKRKRRLTTTWSDRRRKKRRQEDLGSREEQGRSLAEGEKEGARGPQVLSRMPLEKIYDIAVTIIVIRMLAGGVERVIDWSIVMKCIEEFDMEFVKARWRTICTRYSKEISCLSDRFAEKYIVAYAEEEIPTLDFTDVAENDWVGIVDWAKKELRQPLDTDLPDLPDTLATLEHDYNIEVESPDLDIRNLFNYNTSATVPMREAAFAAIPFVTPVRHREKSSASNHTGSRETEISAKSLASMSDVANAQTWIRALALTDAANLDYGLALSKFKTIPEPTQKLALETLLSNKVIHREQSGTARQRQPFPNAPFITHTLSTHALRPLESRRPITPAMLKQAHHFKTSVMDPTFRQGEPITYRPGWTNDGHMVALLELVGRGYVRAAPVDPPSNRYGLIDSYQTRKIDRTKFRFRVDFLPVEGKYVWGRPLFQGSTALEKEREHADLLRRFPPPSIGANGNEEPNKARIPLWRDIHGNLVPRMWDLMVAGTLGILAQRPGVSEAEVAAMLGPAVEEWDVEGLLKWAEGCAAAKRTGGERGRNWEVGEWWWMALEGEDEGEEQDKEGGGGGGEDKAPAVHLTPGGEDERAQVPHGEDQDAPTDGRTIYDVEDNA